MCLYRRIATIGAIAFFAWFANLHPVAAHDDFIRGLGNPRPYADKHDKCFKKIDNRKRNASCRHTRRGHESRNVIVNDESIEIATETARDPVVGLEGTDKDDDITNNGAISVAAATAPGASAVVQRSVAGRAHAANRKPGSHRRSAHHNRHHHHRDPDREDSPDSSANADPDAIGISGRGGDDVIVNNGTVNVASTGVLEDETGAAQAAAVGISGGSGSDSIVNNASLTTQATGLYWRPRQESNLRPTA